MLWYLWRSEDDLCESILSFHHMGPWDQTQLIGLGDIYLLSCHSFFHMAFILLFFNEVYLGLSVYLFSVVNELLLWRL